LQASTPPVTRARGGERRTTSHATAKSEKQRPRAPSRPRRQASINNIGCDWPPAQAAAIAGAKQATPSVTFGSVSQSSAPVGRNAPRNKRSPSALRCSQRALAGCRSTFNIHALLFNAARQCCGARYAAVLPALFPPPFTSGRLRLTSAPPRPGPPRLTGTQAAQPPATMRTHRANARAISLRIRAAAREPALSRIHNSSSCRVPLSPTEGASSPDQHHRIGSQRSNAQLITSPVAREPADPSFMY